MHEKKEIEILQKISNIYESFGFIPIETSSVEKLDSLTEEGEIAKQIFGLYRLGNEEANKKYGLHYDLTLPFVRYICNNHTKLSFPFKRYQIQKVWRGERAQKGRYQEFYQADIDVITPNKISSFYEAELVEVIITVLKSLLQRKFTICINHRKLLQEFYNQLGIHSDLIPKILIIVDKITKIGDKEVQKLLEEKINLTTETSTKIISFSKKKLSLKEAITYLESFSQKTELTIEVKQEFQQLLDYLQDYQDYIIVDFSIARGLDYYTGIVYECFIEELEHYGSICSGGRYDNLANKFSKLKFSGVGLSIGISRLLYILFQENVIPLPPEQHITQVLILNFNAISLYKLNKIAQQLRQENIACEIYPEKKSLNKQLQFASKRNIPFVIFLEEDNSINMKDLRSGEQKEFNLQYIKKSLT